MTEANIQPGADFSPDVDNIPEDCVLEPSMSAATLLAGICLSGMAPCTPCIRPCM